MNSDKIYVYRQDAELPDLGVAWYDRDGNLIDFSNGYSFTVKLVSQKDKTVALTKTAGIVGSNSKPNIIIGWVNNELDIAVGLYDVVLKATNGSGDRFFSPGHEPTIKIISKITP